MSILQKFWKRYALEAFFFAFIALSFFAVGRASAVELVQPKFLDQKPEQYIIARPATTTTSTTTLPPVKKKVIRPATTQPPRQVALPPANNLSHNEIMAQAGIPEEYWSMVEYIIAGENADWNPCKYYGGKVDCNYSGSGAYGIPQSKPGGKMASAGADWRTNPVTQLRWMNTYVGRYGGWAGAVAHKKATGWY